MCRQNYYKKRHQRTVSALDNQLVVEMVQRERRLHPRIGVRKLHGMLVEEMKDIGIKVGRDKMFKLLRENDLLVEPLPKAPRTTDSRHVLPVFRNLIAQLETTAPHQVWVSDVTYVRTDEGFEYLALITDLHSRMIVGYYCGDNLAAAGCIEALNRAIAQLPEDRYPFHHSDQGCQYCCHEYVYHLIKRGLSISMTEHNHCYENAYAERVNGILKQEYGLGSTFRTREQARRAVDQAVWVYNHKRPHNSLGDRVPARVHQHVA